MKNTYYRQCEKCGALLDPGETCSCEHETAVNDEPAFLKSGMPIWDDATDYFDIDPIDENMKTVTLAYRWAEEPPNQWNVLTNENNLGELYNCTLHEALVWLSSLGCFPERAADLLQKKIEADLENMS